MMHLMIRSVMLLLFLFSSTLGFSQQKRDDFSAWYWLQTKYRFNKKTSLNFQLQYRTNQNATSFNKTNFFLSAERKLSKSLNTEALVQFSTDHRSDQYTVYGGVTYKVKLKQFRLYYRCAVQHKRNYFSGDYLLDNPFFEWRNRIRISYPYKDHWTFSVSTEPYLSFSNYETCYFSRIRNVIQANYAFNKFHKMTLFYLIEPTLNLRYSSKNDYVLGLTYQVTIPKKKKEWKKFLDFKEKTQGEKKESNDTFN